MNSNSCRIAIIAVILPSTLLPLGCRRPTPAEEEKAPPANVKWAGPSQNALEEHIELIGVTVPLLDRAARVSASVDGRVASLFPGLDPATAAASTFLGCADTNALARLMTAAAMSHNVKACEGKFVARGTVLLTLDDTIIKSNLARLEANQDVLREELLQSQFAVDLAQAECDRLGKLSESLKSPVEVQKADFALKDARSKLNGSRGKLVAGARDIDALQDQLRLYTLRSPIDGKVGRLQVAVGQALVAGTPVAEVVDLTNQIDVLCYVPPSLVRRLEIGQTAQSGGFGQVESGTTEIQATGQIVYIAEQGEPETGNFAVKVRLDNKGANPLRANRVMHVLVETRPADQLLSVPVAAIMEDEDPPTVVIVEKVETTTNAEGKEETRGEARRLQVKLGVRDRRLRQVQIIGLEDPEKDPAKKWHGDIKDALFIFEGGQGVQTGDKVKLDVDVD